MKDETVSALREVGRAVGAEEFTVIGVRARAPSAARVADGNGNVLLPEAERRALCPDCDRGEEVLLLDDSGVLVGLSAGPGVWSHAYDESFWPCPGVRASGA